MTSRRELVCAFWSGISAHEWNGEANIYLEV